MRIGILHNAYLFRGGEDRVVATEAEMLRTAGHHVSTLVLDNRHAFAKLGPRLKNMARSSAGWNTDAASRVQAWARAESLDLVHIHNLFPLITAAGPDAIRQLRVPLVVTLHNFRGFCAAGTMTRSGGPCDDCSAASSVAALRHGCWSQSRFKTATWLLAQRRARWMWAHDRVTFIAPSEHVRAKYEQAGFDVSRVVVRPHCSDIRPRPEARRCGAVVIGRVEAAKGILQLIEAWPAHGEPLTVIGDGPQLGEARALARENVRVLGQRPADLVARELGRAKVLISASLMPETFGLTLIEAAASGVPAVAFENGGSSSIIENGRTGRLVPRANFGQLVQSAMFYLNNEIDRRRASAATELRFLTRYSERVGLASLERVYRAALDPIGAAA